MALSKKDIFSFDDTVYKTIVVKAWNNGELIIKTMSAQEKIEWVKMFDNKKHTELDALIELMLICCVDENHSKLFDKQDLAALKHKSFEALNFISNECILLSGLHADAVEEEAKN